MGPGSPSRGAYALTIRTFAPLGRFPAGNPPPAGPPVAAARSDEPGLPSLDAAPDGADPPDEHPTSRRQAAISTKVRRTTDPPKVRTRMGARPEEAARAFYGMVREREHGDLGGVTDGTWRSWSVSAGVSCRSVKPAYANGSRTRIGHRRCLGCGTEFGSCQARRSPPRLIQRVWPPVDRDGSKRAIGRQGKHDPGVVSADHPTSQDGRAPSPPPRHARPLPTGVSRGVRGAGIDPLRR
jgi:hypothetical protein